MHRLFKSVSDMDTEEYGRDSFLHFPVQLAEDADRVLVRTLTPGMKRRDLEIVLTGQTLCITGRIPCRNGRFLRQECPCGVFRREIDLGCAVNGDAVSAELAAGVLTVSLPKHKNTRAQRVPVQYEG